MCLKKPDTNFLILYSQTTLNNYISPLSNSEILNASASDKLPKEKWRRNVAIKKVLVGIILFGAFGSLARSPLYFLLKVSDPLNYLILFTFFGIYFIDKAVKRIGFNGMERVFLSILFGMPLYSAIVSHYFWGQPYFYGLITTQLWFYSSVSFMLFYLLKTRQITLHMVRDIMLAICWIQLPADLMLGLFLDPRNYHDKAFAYCTAAKGGCGWMFDISFMSFAYFYYFVRFIKTNHFKYLIFVLILFAYIAFEYQKRALTASMIATTGVYFYFNVSFSKKLYFISLFTLIISVFVSLLVLLKPEALSRVATLYGSALEVLQGEESGDKSADSRITQVLYLGLFYAKHPATIIFGNGKWNDNWSGSPLSMYGRFYPSDIGILGAYFIYGLFGILIVQFEYFMAFLWMRKVKEAAGDAFFHALKYYLLFFWVRSIPTGGSYFYPGAGITAVIITLLYFYRYREKKSEMNYVLE